jgi:DNA polymerase-3 subunit delta
VTAEHVAAYFRGRAESTGFAVADRAVEGEVAAALASQLGMPAWKIRRAQGWLRQWRPESLARAVQAVADADAGIKGAGDDAAFAAERAVITVSACAAE